MTMWIKLRQIFKTLTTYNAEIITNEPMFFTSMYIKILTNYAYIGDVN